ncbi:AAC(3) family N-acetyltransferase [Streptomyces adelaidensis]|uniref:AAC(3) family N-acetyltransferase n=1 Tax=Streptomyces adelaidensis TaxID=2796465 RepID=UPI0027DD9B2F|nr:AAC(3) family N-acetyltransferase [Streptomyces adelaidensis]
MAETALPGGPLSRFQDTLAELGVRRGQVLVAHSSLSGSGLSPTAVRDALLRALGPDGTLVVPAFTPENSDTSREYRDRTEGMTERQRAEFRASMPPFDPVSTPCPTMGALAECVRTTPGAVRSVHPQTSFAGLGPRAAELLTGHDPHCHLGERSPLAGLYEADARILLLRVGFSVCTAFHLAEYRMNPPRPTRTYRCVVRERGWIEYGDLDLYDGDFAEIGARLPRDLRTEREVAGRTTVLIGMRDAVDTALDQMSGYRAEMT